MTADKYFSKLNYSLANEDTKLEVELVKHFLPKKVLSVCGSGGRTLPLYQDSVEDLHCADLAKEQLLLCALKEETIRSLDYENFLLFWGYAPFSPEENNLVRKEIFRKLSLEKDAKKYFNHLYNENAWRSVLYDGSWEKTFAFFSKVVSKVMGSHRDKLFSFNDLDKQREYISKEFPHWRWNLVMGLLGNKSVFNALLYRGRFIKKNINETYTEYYKKAFNHLFVNDLTRKSFFLQLCFYGKIIFSEGNTVEADFDVFKEMKEALKDKTLHKHQRDILSTAKEYGPFDFISLSDVPSYFSGKTEKEFLQDLKSCLNVNGIIVLRNYLRVPIADREGYIDISNEFQEQIDDEKVQMYRVEILQKKSQE